jgi:hypothetical protein
MALCIRHRYEGFEVFRVVRFGGKYYVGMVGNGCRQLNALVFRFVTVEAAYRR